MTDNIIEKGGRPKLPEIAKRSVKVLLAITPPQSERWRDAANQAGHYGRLNDFIRSVMDKETRFKQPPIEAELSNGFSEYAEEPAGESPF